jgi:hypothetical protein
MAYKIKEDNLQFDGVILSLEEGTEVIEGVDKKIKRARQKCDFQAKNIVLKWIMQGFWYLWMMVTNSPFFKDYPHPERRAML